IWSKVARFINNPSKYTELHVRLTINVNRTVIRYRDGPSIARDGNFAAFLLVGMSVNADPYLLTGYHVVHCAGNCWRCINSALWRYSNRAQWSLSINCRGIWSTCIIDIAVGIFNASRIAHGLT